MPTTLIRPLALFAVALMPLTLAAAADPAGDLALLRQRLVERELPYRNSRSPAGARADAIGAAISDPDPELLAALLGRAEAALAILSPDGSWPDIDYTDPFPPGGWAPDRHLQRTLDLARAWRASGGKRFHEPALRALDWWLERDPQPEGWWFQQIGIPLTVGRILLLLEADLTPEQRAIGLRILARGKLGMTGQNLIWVAEVTILRGAFQRDPAPVAEAVARAAEEIRIAPRGKEGLQQDFSFHQHGPQIYSGGYGMGFIHDTTELAALMHDTGWAFPPEKIARLERALLEGYQWMAWGPRFDYSTCGREITRKGAASSRSLLAAARRLRSLDPARAPELDPAIARLERAGALPALEGNRHFWLSDYMVHRREGWMVSLRMSSTRTTRSETINGENPLGLHLADGITYIFRDGDEYDAIFPVWDWQRLPGTTIEQSEEPIAWPRPARGGSSRVGGVSDGEYGFAAMELIDGGLHARKAWLMFDEGFLALGADIRTTGPGMVRTTINQCLRRGSFATPGPEWPRDSRTQWMHHDGVGYLVPNRDGTMIDSSPTTGSWARITATYDETPVTAELFTLWLDHGRSPGGASYEYSVLPGLEAREMHEWGLHPSARAMENDARTQAAFYGRKDVLGAVFWQAGRVASDDGRIVVEVDRPCLLLARRIGDRLHVGVASLESQEETVTVKISGIAEAVAFGLPGGADAGATVLRELPMPAAQ